MVTRRLLDPGVMVILLLIGAAAFPARLPAQDEYYYDYKPLGPEDAAQPAPALAPASGGGGRGAAGSGLAGYTPLGFAPPERRLPEPGPVSPEGRPLRGRADAETQAAGAALFSRPEGGPYAGGGAGEPGIPGFDQALTRRYVEQYSRGGGREWLQAVMKRAGPYIPFIREQIAARNLPPELLYLPVIESGFVPTARSRSGATGLWQFMRNSIAPFDIKINEWADERMDFWKSTEGALRKLEDNYRALGDWPLALAAYNAGLGGVQRAARQAGRADYWYLSEKKFIKTETVHYVPKFLAVAYILSNPRKFALDLDWSGDPRWELIPVGKQVDLGMLAEEAGVDGAALKAANRELFYGITPPDKNYRLKARAADSSRISEALERTETVLIKHYFHTIRYGDTLSALALHYGISVAQITEANPGVRAQYLRIGQQLRIPAYRDAGPYRHAGTTADDALRFTGSHLVKRGETLWSIALAYGVDPEVLAEANGMNLNDTLREGRNLKTPGPEGR
ncbi:MAG: LysM peptidoglycan-binding domain-containing protein [Treponema sp.]|jgi:membrane-bound lytic murein transglycosylase D|nr:LysM peptidoglycan-binding domain-containing protein [Treponema sp.]